MTERDGDPSTLWGFLYRVCSQPGCTLGALAVGSPVIGALLELADPAATVAGLPAYLAGLGAGGAAFVLGAIWRRVQTRRDRGDDFDQ
ncbi:MAG: hypothetical protein M3R63_04415 [Actinomycetota bacterium]|nr:hypothetical protein [Actinomycetota bacterium]